jgi:tetratricopeptide (TPR) repeat protein
VLTGRIRRAGDRARITAELVDVATGNSTWTGSFPAEFKDLFAAEEQIARAIATELKVTLADGTELARRATANPQAHDLYLRGRFYMQKYTETDLRRGLAMFEQAVALDSTYATAWAGIADVWRWLADDFIPSREAYPRARAATLRALALDPTGADVLAGLAMQLYWGDWKPDSAYRVAIRAREANPNSAEVWLGFYWLYLHRGQDDSVLVALRHLQNLNPLDPIPVTFACETHLRKGEVTAAQRECERALAIEPHYTPVLARLADVLAVRKMFDSALRVLGPPPGNHLARASLYNAWGRTAEARREFQAAEASARGQYRRALWFFRTAASLGDVAATVRWGELSLEQHDAGLTNPQLSAQWPPAVLSDARVQSLLRRIESAKQAAEPVRR